MPTPRGPRDHARVEERVGVVRLEVQGPPEVPGGFRQIAALVGDVPKEGVPSRQLGRAFDHEARLALQILERSTLRATSRPSLGSRAR